MSECGFTTSLVHLDRRSGSPHGAVHQPMHPSAEYAFSDSRELTAVFQGKSGYTYSRQGSPTTSALEAKITQMEQGINSVCFASGMAALTAVFMTLLKSGDHIISSQHIFGNTNSLLETLTQFGIELTLVDATDVRNVEQARKANTRMVFTESLANPGTQIAAMQEIGTWCRDQQLLYVLDNTLTTPWLLRGKDVGAGLVVSSLSKHIGGHGNALGGVVTDTGLFDWNACDNITVSYRQGDPRSWGLTQIKKKGLRDMGAALSSESAHRLAVGAETLSLRLTKSCDNAMALARALESHPKVVAVRYPGLRTHPQHERAKALFGGSFGTLLGVELDAEINVFDFLNKLKVFILATHLGDTRTLVLPVAHTIYYEMGADKREQMGIPDNLLRISVGIEEHDDLIRDFTDALS